MSNIEVYAPLVDGGLSPLHEEGESCSLLVETILGDDLRPPPRCLTIRIRTESGKEVIIIVPNDQSNAVVRVDGEIV